MDTKHEDPNDARLYNELFDDFLEISPNALEFRDYKALVIPNLLNPLEAEWLAESFGIGKKIDVLITDGNKKRIGYQTRISKRDVFIQTIFENPIYNLLVGKFDMGFFFKPDSNRFTIIFGKESFVRDSWRGTVDTARILYFDYWADDYGIDSAEYKDLLRVWKKYEPYFPKS
ncbi:hypothetical protein Pla110_43100 [Polystyrenella longa]|uniref:Uncharacterized protein n=1 Tax=Polystyrenella longa TaxID=2528007 RepID=A0A518CTI7_9PLAN|nr:hypothetical protein [Polystyrenella longa]QDU82552.1 hypothetical protein Pla110_43100 [Polystyrenella longa]